MVWERAHGDGVIARVRMTPFGRFAIEVVEPTGRPVTFVDLSRPTLEDALERADEIVRLHRPHAFERTACSGWVTTGPSAWEAVGG